MSRVRDDLIQEADRNSRSWAEVKAGLEKTVPRRVYMVTHGGNRILGFPRVYLKGRIKFEILATDSELPEYTLKDGFWEVQYQDIGSGKAILERVFKRDLPIYVGMKHTLPGLEMAIRGQIRIEGDTIEPANTEAPAGLEGNPASA